MYSLCGRSQLIYKRSVLIHMDLLGIHNNRNILPAAVFCNVSAKFLHILVCCCSGIVIEIYRTIGG